MTAPRVVVPGATYAITRRCAFRKLFLTPLTPIIHQGLLYALGVAQLQSKVLLHGEVFMPNPVHPVRSVRRMGDASRGPISLRFGE